MKIKSTDHEAAGKPIVVCLECHRTGAPVTAQTSNTANNKAVPETVGKYIVLDNLKFPLVSPDWSAKEELLLIQGIMKCGMGNWIDISEQYIKTKTPDECEEHYFTFYYKSKENNLPTGDDCIIQGSRNISKNAQGESVLEIPVNQAKSDNSFKRVK